MRAPLFQLSAAAGGPVDVAMSETVTRFVDAVARGVGVNRAAAIAALQRDSAKIGKMLGDYLKRDGSATDRRLSQVRADLDRLSSRLLGTSAPEIQLTRDESNSIRLLTGQHLGGRKLSAAQARELVLKRTRKRK